MPIFEFKFQGHSYQYWKLYLNLSFSKAPHDVRKHGCHHLYVQARLISQYTYAFNSPED